RPAHQPLYLGSLKSNIGHTQAAAGVSGVIKMVEALRRGVAPKTLHVDEPSPHVEWDSGAVELLTENRDWPETGRPRRAGVSSFGISGTNAHVIIEQAPEVEDPAPVADGGVVPWVLSGRTDEAVREQAARLTEWISQAPELDVAGVGLTLATARSRFERGAVVVGADREELLTSLAEVADGRAPLVGPSGSGVGMLFAGQGGQRVGMGRELYAAHPVFATAVDDVLTAVDKELAGFVDHPVRDVLFDTTDTGLLDQTVYTQSALFAIEVGLYRLLESWGVRPAWLVGHSIGEIAAAHVAGVFSLEDAARLVAARGRLMQALPEGGAMAAVEAAEADVLPFLDDAVGIAAVNGPTSVVVSGEHTAVERVTAHFENAGHRVKRLKVSHAFHSPLMEPMLNDFAEVVKSLTFHPPSIPIVSTVTGLAVEPDTLTDPAYWVHHVRTTVRFHDAITHLADHHTGGYVEIGPSGVLVAQTQHILDATGHEGHLVLPTLRPGQSETHTILTALGRLYAAGTGVTPHWQTVFGDRTTLTDLPTYPFQRQHYWLHASSLSGDPADLALTPSGHALLGAAVYPAGSDTALFTGRLSTATHPWLVERTDQSEGTVPHGVLVDLALHVSDQLDCDVLRDLTVVAPMVLSDSEGGALHVQLAVEAPDADGVRTVTVHSRPDDPDSVWTLHATGAVHRGARETGRSDAEWPGSGAEAADPGALPPGVTAMWRRGEEILAEIALPDELADRVADFGIHPLLVDSALRVASWEGTDGDTVPYEWTGVRLHAVGGTKLRVLLTPRGDGVFGLHVGDAAGQPVLTVESVALRSVAPPSVALRPAPSSAAAKDALFRITWSPTLLPAAGGEGRRGEDGSNVLIRTVPPTLPGADPVAATHAAAQSALALVQEWLSDERQAATRLIVLTAGAVPVEEGAPVDLAHATVWGLLRSAQAEHPGRLVLVDGETGSEPERRDVLAAAALGEPQVALRGVRAFVPRMTRLPVPTSASTSASASDASPWNTEGTVLITGGTG
ncbi:type I polyketide synthase, partial [Streptomyces narbonensis]